MVNTENLLDELIDMGHSLKWATKKVELTEIDNSLEEIGMQTDILVASGKPFSLISAELDRLAEEQNKLQEQREKRYSELKKIEEKEESNARV